MCPTCSSKNGKGGVGWVARELWKPWGKVEIVIISAKSNFLFDLFRGKISSQGSDKEGLDDCHYREAVLFRENSEDARKRYNAGFRSVLHTRNNWSSDRLQNVKNRISSFRKSKHFDFYDGRGVDSIKLELWNNSPDHLHFKNYVSISAEDIRFMMVVMKLDWTALFQLLGCDHFWIVNLTFQYPGIR